MIIDLIPEEDLSKVPDFSLKGHKTYARFSDCYDGDSTKAIFSFQGSIFKWTCRLDGIDTPELRTKNTEEKKAAIVARDALKGIIMGPKLKIECGEFDKFGRLLVKIETAEGKDVGESMIEQGYAKPYHGGHRPEWNFKV
jgi:micrococcal nuclease